MIRRKRLPLLGNSALAMSLFSAASVCAPVLCALGQTIAVPYLVTSPGTSARPAAATNFLAAPAFSLSAAPSSAISADLNGDGKPDLIVASALTGEITVYLGAGQGRFSDPAAYNTGGHPVAIAAADLRGTGRQDIVTANGTDKTVSVLFGLGDGKLGPAQVYSTGIEADLLVAGSLKASGQPDVAVVSTSGRSLAVLLNDGHGALLTPTTQSLPRTPTSLILARFSASGHADLALANTDGTVSILPGRGDGTFSSATLLNVASGALSLIVSGDFDRDGKTDLAVAQPEGRLLTILRGNGDGSFIRGASYTVGNDPVHALSLDVNGDGIPDLVTANRGSNTFSTLLGNGDGSFKAAVHSTVGGGPVALASGDFYGRGFIGLAVLNAAAKSVSVIDGNGDGSFNAALSYSGDLSPRSIVSGDLNGDGRPDLVVANFCGADAACAKSGTLSVYLAKASGGYTLASKIRVGAGPVSVALADLNGDKHLDAIVLNRTGKSVSILSGAGDGTFGEPRTLSLADSPAALALGDFNRDGKTDLAIVSDCGAVKCSQPGVLTIFFGAGDGSFTAGLAYPVGYSPASVAVADIDLDGNPDIVVANRCGADQSCASHGTASLFAGDGKGGFTAKADIALGNAPSSIALGSLSGGKAPDLVVTNETDNTVAVFLGNGDGTFSAPATYAVGSAPRSAVIADFTGRGMGTATGIGTKSVAVANFKDSTVSLLTGKGDGTLQPAISYSVGAGPESLAAVIAKSGDASIVTANGSSASAAPGLDITDLSHAAIGTAAATLAVQGTISPYNYGAPSSQTLLTATLTPTPANANTPTGSVTLIDTSNADATVCVISALIPAMGGASYSGSCSPSPSAPLTVGTHVISATYLGDSVYAMPATITPYSQTVNAAPTSVTLSPSSGNEPLGQSISFTATVSQQSPGTVAPSGGTVAVTVSSNGTTVAPSPTVTPTSGGVFTFAYTPTALGTITVSATYTTTDPDFAGSTSSTATFGVIPGSTTVAVTGPSSATYGSMAGPFTATVSPTGGGTLPDTTPASTVTFTAALAGQTYNLCTGSLSAGSASCSVANLILPPTSGSATYMITATYSGDKTNGTYPSNSGTLGGGLTVGQATPAVTLTQASSNANAVVNQQLMFTAGVSNVPPGGSPLNGTFTFKSLLSGVTTTLCSGVSPASPTCSTSLAAGGNMVTASYDNDTNFKSSTSPTLQESIGNGKTTIALSPASGNSVIDQAVTFTAAVAQAPASGPLVGSILPTGTITFSAALGNAAPSPIAECTAVPIAAGSAACTTRSLGLGAASGVGIYSITAAYNPTQAGSANLNFDGPGTSNTITQTVGAAASKISLQFFDNGTPGQTATVNDTVKFVATVVADASNSAPIQPSGGTVQFTATYNPYIPATGPSTTVAFQCVEPSVLTSAYTGIAGTGTVSCTPKSPTNLPAGGYTVSARYSPGTADLNFSASPASTLTEAVNPEAVTALAITSMQPASPTGAVPPSGTTSVATQTVTFNAALTFKPQAAASMGPVLPSGVVNFTTTGGGAIICQPPSPAPTVVTANGQTSATCAITFESGAAGPISVNATYPGDNNFLPFTATAVMQTVQDFALVAPGTNVSTAQLPSGATGPAQLYVTQGYAIGTPAADSSAIADPFFTAPAATVNSISGFTDKVSFSSCTIAAGAPACVAASATALSAAAAGTLPFSIVANSQTIPAATPYIFTLTGVDSSLSSLTRNTAPFTVTVVPVTPNQSVSVSAAETSTAQFIVPSPSDTFAFACSQAFNISSTPVTSVPLVSSNTPGPGGLYCKPTSATGPLTAASDGTFTSTFLIGNKATASAQAENRSARRSMPVFAFVFIGVPLFGLAGLLGRKKNRATGLVRLLGAAILLGGLSQAIGCGSDGGFTVPANSATGAAFSTGTYLVRVSATDQSTNITYFSTIQFTAGQ